MTTQTALFVGGPWHGQVREIQRDEYVLRIAELRNAQQPDVGVKTSMYHRSELGMTDPTKTQDERVVYFGTGSPELPPELRYLTYDRWPERRQGAVWVWQDHWKGGMPDQRAMELLNQILLWTLLEKVGRVVPYNSVARDREAYQRWAEAQQDPVQREALTAETHHDALAPGTATGTP